jgi:TyrR family helix-turn-helix protein
VSDNRLAQALGYKDEESMLRLLYAEGLSMESIGERLGMSHTAVNRRMNKYGIERRTAGGSNNHGLQSWRLARADQRLVFGLPDTLVAEMFQVHRSTVYKYKREATRHGNRLDLPNKRLAEIRLADQDPHGLEPHQD